MNRFKVWRILLPGLCVFLLPANRSMPFEGHLFVRLVLVQLMADVFLDCLFAGPYRTHEISRRQIGLPSGTIHQGMNPVSQRVRESFKNREKKPIILFPCLDNNNKRVYFMLSKDCIRRFSADDGRTPDQKRIDRVSRFEIAYPERAPQNGTG